MAAVSAAAHSVARVAVNALNTLSFDVATIGIKAPAPLHIVPARRSTELIVMLAFRLQCPLNMAEDCA